MNFTFNERKIIDAYGKLIAEKLREGYDKNMMVVSFIMHNGGSINLVPFSNFIFRDFETKNPYELKSVHRFDFNNAPEALQSIETFIEAWLELAKIRLDVTEAKVNGKYVRITYGIDNNSTHLTAFYHVTDTIEEIVSEFLNSKRHNNLYAFLQSQMNKYFVML